MKIFKKQDDVFAGSIMGMSGLYEGAIFRLDPGESITFGRDPKTCQIVVDEHCELVSRTHCTVCGNLRSGTYSVTDRASKNGTLVNGQRLKSGASVEVPRGTVIALGDPSNSFRLN